MMPTSCEQSAVTLCQRKWCRLFALNSVACFPIREDNLESLLDGLTVQRTTVPGDTRVITWLKHHQCCSLTGYTAVQTVITQLTPVVLYYLGALSPDAASKLNVFGHDGDTFGVDGTQVGILKQSDQVSFSCFLQSQDSVALEPQIRLQKCGRTCQHMHDKDLQVTHQSIMLYIPWNPVRFHERGVGKEACGSTTRCSSGIYEFHCERRLGPSGKSRGRHHAMNKRGQKNTYRRATVPGR